MGNQERVSVTYKNLINNLKVGDHVLINNGLIILEVEKLKAPDAMCKVLVRRNVPALAATGAVVTDTFDRLSRIERQSAACKANLLPDIITQ